MPKRFVQNKKYISLHLGCGKRYIPEFTYHIDARKFSHIDYVASADKLDMFKDNSADLIYACHLLEHFKRNETDKVLKEWRRVLKKGGVLRISVPDFSVLVKVYSRYKDLSLISGPLYGRQDYPENTHYTSFDFKFLKKLLEKAGFKDIRRYDWRKTIHKNYDDYSQAYIPHLDKEKGILISLNIEALKK